MPSIVEDAEPQPVATTAPAASLGYTSMAPPAPIPHAPAPRYSVLLYTTENPHGTDYSKHIRGHYIRSPPKYIFAIDDRDAPL
ncbi:hypothetical protein V9T40_007132 [Parthenolecanium corni]|uniref:Uncharacterized protein n=1 Tax=Parthenolecanium corni TaxID=536013 RepID=A0AAN9TU01_9HEMI